MKKTPIRFTDMMLKNFKVDKDKTKSAKKSYLRESGGLAVRVMLSGVKTFLFIYTFEGRRKELNLGNYPDVKLADARTAYGDARKKLISGIDPAKEVREVKDVGEVISDNPTISELVENFLKNWTDKVKTDKGKYDDRRCLTKDVVPVWGTKAACDIRRKDAIQLLEKIAERAPGQARNVLKVCRKMFSFALQRSIVEYNPFSGISLAIPELQPVKRQRVLSADEIKILWANLETGSGSKEVKNILRLILLTAQRPGEIAGMSYQEVSGKWLTVAPERVKSKDKRQAKPHHVYLSPVARKIIGTGKGLVFSAPVKKENLLLAATSNSKTIPKSIAVNALSHRIRTAKYYGIDPFTPHDLRRTARTFMAEIGIPSEHAEAVLNHAIVGIQGVYNLYQYDKEKREALIKWSWHLRKILKGK